MTQLEGLLKGVNDAKTSSVQKLSQQQEVKNGLMKKRQEQVVTQQQYFALINKLKDSVKKNEQLVQRLNK